MFSIFDPQSSLLNNWVSIYMGLPLLSSFWLLKNSFMMNFNHFLMAILKEFKALSNTLFLGSNLIPISKLVLLMMVNGFGLISYIFTASSHLTFSLTMALPLWIGHMLFSWARQPIFMLAHLVPLGTPALLAPFMVIIELLSNFIRPLTLSIRLTANMMAGHLLLTLLSSQALNLNIFFYFLLISMLMTLATLELAVACIQSYVFSVLSTLYLNEVNSPNLSNL